MVDQPGTPEQAPASPKKKRGCLRIFAYVIAALIALSIVGAIMSGGDDSNTSGTDDAAQSDNSESSDGESDEEAEPEEPEEPSNKASGDNEPHVSAGESVIVDTLEWRVVGTATAAELGNEFSKETADGIFAVVKLSVRNGKDESVTINSSQITLQVNDRTYETNSDGTIALQLSSDEEVFFLTDLGPDVTTEASVVFDVPPAVLNQSPEVCFGELGFGDTKGCIALQFS